MKRIWLAMLTLMLLMVWLFPATAVNTEILPEDERDTDAYRAVVQAVPAGDTLYILTRDRTAMTLWYWRADMVQAEAAPGRLVSAYHAAFEELDGQAQPVSAIFSDGGQLYGLNHLDGSVFTIDLAEDGLRCINICKLENLAPMQGQSGEATAYRMPQSALVTSGRLIWHTQGERSVTDGRVYVYDLGTGNVKQVVADYVQAVTPYRDGQVLLLCGRYYNAPCQVYAYDPVTDDMQLLGTTPELGDIGGVSYAPGLDLLIYQDDTCIMGWHPETGVRQVGFVPLVEDGALTVLGDTVVHVGNKSVTARTLVADFATAHSLRIFGGNLNDVVRSFARQYEDVPYYYMSHAEALDGYEALLTREENAADLLFLNVADGLRYELTDKPGMVSAAGDFAALRDAGLLLDLSGSPELAAYVDTLYPAFRDLVTKDGGVYGIPVAATSYDGWFINKRVMNDLGLTAEEIPTNLVELMAFATRWNAEFADAYPQYTLLDNTEEYRQRFLDAILDGWYGYCQAMELPVTFNDPVFLQLLEALDAMEADRLNANLQLTNPEASEYAQALIWTGCKVVGNWAGYMEAESDRIFIPLSLTPDTPYLASVEDVRLWVVNTRSENAEYAAALLAEKVQHLDPAHARVLQTTRATVELNPSDQATLDEEYAVLAELEASLRDSVNPAAAQARIDEQRARIEDYMLQDIYDGFPSALKNYVQVIVPAMYIRTPDAVTRGELTDDFRACMQAYVAGEMDAAAFAAALSTLTAQAE